jgi:hypothetical protein
VCTRIDDDPDSPTYGLEVFYVLCAHPNLRPLNSVPDLFVWNCPTRERAIEDWNKENPIRMRQPSAIFSEEDCAEFYRKYTRIRSRVELLQRNPTMLPDKEKCPHIWKRLDNFATMTYDELMDEIEADCVLLRDCW